MNMLDSPRSKTSNALNRRAHDGCKTFIFSSQVTFHYRAIKAKMDEPLDEENLAEAVIDDTRTTGNGPFELLIERNFKIDAWEEAIKEMLIGEVSRYYCPYEASCLFGVLSVCDKSHHWQSLVRMCLCTCLFRSRNRSIYVKGPSLCMRTLSD